MDQRKLTVRKPTRSNRDDLARQMVEAAAAKLVVIPALTDDEALEVKGIEVTRGISKAHMVAAATYYEIWTRKLWEYRGIAGPAEYFENVIGIAWRTCQQALAIWEAHLALPEGERGDARVALEGLGVYKAGLLAPIVKEHPEEFGKWIETAKSLSRDALQERVSQARGLPPKKGTDGDRLYNTFVGRLDNEQREEFEDTYRALKLITASDDFVVNTAVAYREGKVDWLAQAERIRTGHGNA